MVDVRRESPETLWYFVFVLFGSFLIQEWSGSEDGLLGFESVDVDCAEDAEAGGMGMLACASQFSLLDDLFGRRTYESITSVFLGTCELFSDL